MAIFYAQYPWAFFTPGGGEIQLLKYIQILKDMEVEIHKFDPWKPEIRQGDILHYFSCMSGSFPFLSYLKSKGIKIIVSPNLWVTLETKNDFPSREIEEILKLSDRIICNSNAECDLLSECYSVNREQFVTVYNGFDSNYLYSVDDAKCFLDKYEIPQQYILNVANIEPRKNQLNLIKSMKYFPDFKLIICGHIRDSKYATNCFELAGDQCIYLGYLDHCSSDLRAIYQSCSLFALPSMVETPGLAALEAKASGVQVVITNIGSTREYFGNSVFYVDPCDVTSITGGIHNALTNNISKDFKFISKYLWKNVLFDLKKTYMSMY